MFPQTQVAPGPETQAASGVEARLGQWAETSVGVFSTQQGDTPSHVVMEAGPPRDAAANGLSPATFYPYPNANHTSSVPPGLQNSQQVHEDSAN